MQKDIRFERHRRFHDAWAFVLYIIAFLAINTALLLSGKSVGYIAVSLDYGEVAWIVGINFLFVVSSVAVCYLIMIYMPRLIIYASIFILPAVMIFFRFFYSKGASTTDIVSLVLMLIFFAAYFFACHRHMNYMVKMVSTSTSILMGNFGTLLLAALFLGLFSFVQLAIVFLADHNSISARGSVYAALLMLSWTLSNSQYIAQVFVSSLVVAETTRNDEKRGKLNLAFRNTFAALGSICLGGLLLALISVLKTLISGLKERNSRRSDGGSLLCIILLCFLMIIASLIEDIISCANRMAFPYLALHGTCYKDSVIESSNLIIGSDAKNLAAFIGIDLAIALLSFILTLFSLLINKMSISSSFFGSSPGMVSITALFLVFYCIFEMLSMISAGCLALIFVNISAPDSLINYDYELSNIITQKRVEMG